jgi:transposase-like protein
MLKRKTPLRKRPLRGRSLDEAVDRELAIMISEGYVVAPISIASVARRLGLGSRTTLYQPTRLAKIRAAITRQREQSNSAQGARRHKEDAELKLLRKKLNDLRAYVAQIAINAHRMGIRPEALLPAIRSHPRESDPPAIERIVLDYLSEIGLLAKLDPNVRHLAR